MDSFIVELSLSPYRCVKMVTDFEIITSPAHLLFNGSLIKWKANHNRGCVV